MRHVPAIPCPRYRARKGGGNRGLPAEVTRPAAQQRFFLAPLLDLNPTEEVFWGKLENT